MKLLDLFCGAGGAGEGYRLSGFDVTGVDIQPQPKNPHRFVLCDALEFVKDNFHDFDAIHCSPPCQAYSKASKQWRKLGYKYPDLIFQIRELLKNTGKPWVIENVIGSPLVNPTFLNGSMFGLRIHRPRLFETNFPVPLLLDRCWTPIKMGRTVCSSGVVQPVGHFSGVEYVAKEMGCQWMGQKELSQAIPPAYTQFIGEALKKFIVDNTSRDW